MFFIQPCDREADIVLFAGHSGIIAGVRDGVDAVVQADIHNTAAKICYLAGVLALYLTLLQIVHAGFGKRAADICPDGKMLGILTADLLHADQNPVADTVKVADVGHPLPGEVTRKDGTFNAKGFDAQHLFRDGDHARFDQTARIDVGIPGGVLAEIERLPLAEHGFPAAGNGRCAWSSQCP